jgi:GNAT superfamily N-acetyltransferase
MKTQPGGHLLIMRAYHNSDLIDLTRLINSTIDSCYAAVYPSKAIAYFKDYHSPENVAADAAEGITLVGFYSGRLAGTGTLKGSYICRVFVRPDCQGLGVGKTIYQELERLATKREIKELTLDASLTSLGFWQRRGFTAGHLESYELDDGQRLDYYSMRKEIRRTGLGKQKKIGSAKPTLTPIVTRKRRAPPAF